MIRCVHDLICTTHLPRPTYKEVRSCLCVCVCVRACVCVCWEILMHCPLLLDSPLYYTTMHLSLPFHRPSCVTLLHLLLPRELAMTGGEKNVYIRLGMLCGTQPYKLACSMLLANFSLAAHSLTLPLARHIIMCAVNLAENTGKTKRHSFTCPVCYTIWECVYLGKKKKNQMFLGKSTIKV